MALQALLPLLKFAAPLALNAAKGQTQIAAPAPAPNLGGAAQDPFNLPARSNPVGDAVNSLPQSPMSGLGGSLSSLLGSMGQDPFNLPTKGEGMESAVADEVTKKFGFSDFLGGIDKGLQSPAQLLGLGLLGQIAPNLPLGGLLAMGLLNNRKQ